MKELVMILAAASPVEELVRRVEEAIAVWKENPTEETQHHMGFAMHLYLMKESIEDAGGLENFKNRFDEIAKGMKIVEQAAKVGES